MFCEWKVYNKHYNKHNMFVVNFLPTKHMNIKIFELINLIAVRM